MKILPTKFMRRTLMLCRCIVEVISHMLHSNLEAFKISKFVLVIIVHPNTGDIALRQVISVPLPT